MFVFIDESGELSNYTLTGSRYFLCTAVLMDDCKPIEALQELRYQLEHEGFPLPRGFHARHDPLPRRRRVLETLAMAPISIHSIALKKERVYQDLRDDEAFVYRIACRILLKFLFSDHLPTSEQHSIVFGTYGTGETARRLKSYLRSTIEEFGSRHDTRVAFWDACTHAGLQIADYCAWMTQRHLENPGQDQAREFHHTIGSSCGDIAQTIRCRISIDRIGKYRGGCDLFCDLLCVFFSPFRGFPAHFSTEQKAAPGAAFAR